jgi:plastocyanin
VITVRLPERLAGRAHARLAAASALAAAAALAVAVAGALPGAAASTARSASTHTVVLKGLRFHPSTLSIRRGDSVRWLWRDSGIAHNVTFHRSHSRTQGSGSYTLRFAHSGTFSYRCTIHEALGMRGKIVVH